MSANSIVLAGGKGLRLGRDKISETIGGRSLLQWVVFNLVSFNKEIIIVTAGEQSLPQFAGCPKLRIVTDAYLGKGPLVGVYTGLVASRSFYNLVVACDMPFLNQALLHYMLQISASFDMVVPRLGDMIEPLHTVYSKGCLDSIEYLLKQNNLSVRALLARVRVRYVETEEIDRFDPKHLSFFKPIRTPLIWSLPIKPCLI